jgi:aminodeoxyfutalosine deaminase
MLAAVGVDAARRAPGQSPVDYLASLGAFDGGSPPLLVHMVHAGADDRRIAREARATVVVCPRSNLHIGGLLPDVPALLADGVAMALGTDSLASTPDLSLWGEMATLAGHFPAVPAARWLEAATRGGAEAIGLPAHGTLAPGKRPGVLDVLVDDLAAPVESLVRDPSPTLRWVARA